VVNCELIAVIHPLEVVASASVNNRYPADFIPKVIAYFLFPEGFCYFDFYQTDIRILFFKTFKNFKVSSLDASSINMISNRDSLVQLIRDEVG
jgi:hypothetical protein